MNNPTAFSAGETLLPVQGDPRRQAIASLRGYAYQIYASALAWVGLQSGEELHLEVAEDYATLVGNVLTGVQVKDTAGSSKLTINNQDVLDALDGFVDLVERNPGQQVHLRYLTTSEIGMERDSNDRADGEAVLLYWRKAAAATDVSPLRSALLVSGISSRVRAYISSRTDQQLRDDLLKRVHWDTGSKSLAEIQSLLSTTLVEFASDRLRATPSDCLNLSDVVISRVLDTIVETKSARKLGMVDLLRTCEAVTKMSLSKSTLEGLLAVLAPAGGGGQLAFGSRFVLEPEDSYSSFQNTLPRSTLIDAISVNLKSVGVVFVVGGSGMGKTTAARVTARRFGGRWSILSLLDRSVKESEHLISLAVGQVSTLEFSGLIVDDFNEIESPSVRQRFAQLLTAVHRRDAVCIVTSYREPTAHALEACGLSLEPIIKVPNIDQDEVEHLVTASGGDAARSARLVFLLSSMGHPQLVKAIIASARRSGWTNLGGDTISIEDVQADLDSERRRLRRTLIDRLDASSRRLLLRTSLLHGRFTRELGVSLGDVSPILPVPGELLNSLVGAWIDEVGAGRLRVSPLVGNAGIEDLSAIEQQAIHAHAALQLIPSDNTLDVRVIDTLYFHAIRGEVEELLTKLALAVMTTPQEKLQQLADAIPELVYSKVNRPIFSKNLHLSKMLRFAQLLLISESPSPMASSVWSALCGEILEEKESKGARMFESLVLSRALISSSLPFVFPRPMQVLQRFFEIAKTEPELLDVVNSLEEEETGFSTWTGSLASFLFTTVAMRVGTVDRQRQLFSDLDNMGLVACQMFLPKADVEQGWAQTVVNAAWLEESKAGTLKPAAAAASFEALENLCARWRRFDLAVRFRVARAVMHDEFANSPESAERILIEGEKVFGLNPAIARAKVRLRFRHKRYQDVLSELDVGPHATLDADPLEQALLCREIGISAAATGDWKGASGWFTRAYKAFLSSPSGSLPHLRIGLRADAALAGFKSGACKESVIEYGETLNELFSLDPNQSLGAAYCHRVVRHGLLWLFAESRGNVTGLEINGEAPYLAAGMCSNIDPPEAIRTQALAHPDSAWYILASIEARYLGNALARSNLNKKLHGRQVVSLELTCRDAFLECAIRRRSAREFVEAIRPWMNCCIYVAANIEELKKSSLVAPSYGTVPEASGSSLAEPFVQKPLLDAVVAFGVICATSRDAESLRELANLLQGHAGCQHVVGVLERMLFQPVDEDKSKHQFISSAIRLVLEGRALAPAEIYLITLRLLQACHGNSFQPIFKEFFITWVKTQWHQITTQRFALDAPRIVIPAVEAALKLSGLRLVATLLRTTNFGFRIRLDTSFHTWLKNVEDSESEGRLGDSRFT